MSIEEKCSNKQFSKAESRRDRSHKAPTDDQTCAANNLTHLNGRPPSGLRQIQNTIRQSAVGLAATCKQPIGREGTLVADVDVDEVLYMGPVSGCESIPVDTFRVEEKHQDQPVSFSLETNQARIPWKFWTTTTPV